MKAGLSAAASLAAVQMAPQIFAADGKKVPVALELYSLRRTAPDDVPGTLKKVAEMGYEGVEFAGTYNLQAAELRKMIDDVGLKGVSAHVGLHAILGDNFYGTADFYRQLGATMLIVPGGLEPAIVNDAGNAMTANLFNELAEKAKKEGFQIGFHPHTGDFRKVEGTETPAWQLFLERTSEDVIGQIDIGWCNNSGNDPAEMIARFPGRAKIVHVKSNNNDVAGCCVADADDKVDWQKVFAACENEGGTQWYIVEQEQFKVSELDSARECRENMKKLGR